MPICVSCFWWEEEGNYFWDETQDNCPTAGSLIWMGGVERTTFFEALVYACSLLPLQDLRAEGIRQSGGINLILQMKKGWLIGLPRVTHLGECWRWDLSPGFLHPVLCSFHFSLKAVAHKSPDFSPRSQRHRSSILAPLLSVDFKELPFPGREVGVKSGQISLVFVQILGLSLTLHGLKISLDGVRVSLGCHNKIPWTSWLQLGNAFLTVLEAGNSMIKGLQSRFYSEASSAGL